VKSAAPVGRDPGRGAPPNARAAVAANSGRFWELFLDALATYS
jgi:hypothetical protein